MKELKSYIYEGIFSVIDADMGEVLVDATGELVDKYLDSSRNGIRVEDGKIMVGVLYAMGLNNPTDKNYCELMSGEHIHYIECIKKITIGDDRNKLSSLNSGPVIIKKINDLTIRLDRRNTFDIEKTQIEIEEIDKLIIYMNTAFYDAKKLSDFLNKTKVNIIDIHITNGIEDMRLEGIKCNILTTDFPDYAISRSVTPYSNENTEEWYNSIMDNNNIKKLFIRYSTYKKRGMSFTETAPKYYWVKKKGNDIIFTLQKKV